MIYSNIIDTHSHYDDRQFDEDRDILLSSLCEKGVSRAINCGCSFQSSLRSVELSEKYDFIYAAVGIHPEEANEIAEGDFDKIKKLYSHPKVVAVGEIGLEYHYDFVPKEIQLEVFERQLILAKELDMPVIVHNREAHEDTMTLLKKYRPKGVLHCFSGSVETAKEVLSLGMYIGLGGAVTFKNARKPLEVAAMLPLDRLLLETDCPYMAPVPYRGKRNDSSLIAFVAEKLAEVKGCDTQELINQCKLNAERLFFERK